MLLVQPGHRDLQVIRAIRAPRVKQGRPVLLDRGVKQGRPVLLDHRDLRVRKVMLDRKDRPVRMGRTAWMVEMVTMLPSPHPLSLRVRNAPLVEPDWFTGPT